MTELEVAEIIKSITGIIVIAMGLFFVVWIKGQKERTRQATLKALLENGANLQDPKIIELLEQQTSSPIGDREETYAGLRIGGTVCLFLALGIPVMFFTLTLATEQPELKFIGLGVGTLLACIGAGLLYSSRYVAPSKEIQDKGISRD